MKRINPSIFRDTDNGFETHGDLNYPTFTKELLLRPGKEIDTDKGKVTLCYMVINDTFYERVKKYKIKKITWPKPIKVLTKDLVDFE